MEQLNHSTHNKTQSSKMSNASSSASDYEQYIKQYYIIAGCFKEVENANKLLEKLKSEGFAASVVDTTSSGLIRVCFSGHSSMNEALKSIVKIKISGVSAWLLSI